MIDLSWVVLRVYSWVMDIVVCCVCGLCLSDANAMQTLRRTMDNVHKTNQTGSSYPLPQTETACSHHFIYMSSQSIQATNSVRPFLKHHEYNISSVTCVIPISTLAPTTLLKQSLSSKSSTTAPNP